MSEITPPSLFGLDTFKAFLKIQDDASQDDVLTLIGNAVSGACEKMTRRAIAPREENETHVYDGTGRPILHLRTYPIISVTSVTVINGAGEDDVLVEEEDYRVDLRLGRIIRTAGTGTVLTNHYDRWPRGFQNIEVVLKPGYSEVPYDLQLAALQVGKFIYDQWQTGTLTASSINLSQVSMTVIPGLPKDVRDTILRYRTRSI